MREGGGRDEGGGVEGDRRETGRKGLREGHRDTGRKRDREEGHREGRGGARGSPGREGGEGVLSRRRHSLWWALGVYWLSLSSVVVVLIRDCCRCPLALALSHPLVLSHPLALSRPFTLLRPLALSCPLAWSLSLLLSAVVVRCLPLGCSFVDGRWWWVRYALIDGGVGPRWRS